MTRAWILMTALPPTKGHLNLIRFGASLADEVHVIVCTQPSEPFWMERFRSVRNAAKRIPFENGMPNTSRYGRVEVHHLHEELMQDPSLPGFWDMWDSIMHRYGVGWGDYYVSSEPYGATLAKRLGGIFMPYDPNRELYYTKATNIREHLPEYFHQIMPEFQHVLRTNVVLFGAESTGKTTLSKEMSKHMRGHWLFEWARPYLETVGKEITVEKMEAIWHGQTATQRHARFMYDKPFAFFDTDLFSTIGYWEQPHWLDELGPVPNGLIKDAHAYKSDLYIITKSNIPFERDSIRYGIDKRESPDEYWIDLAEKYGLNYVLLNSESLEARKYEAEHHIRQVADKKAASIQYERQSND